MKELSLLKKISLNTISIIIIKGLTGFSKLFSNYLILYYLNPKLFGLYLSIIIFCDIFRIASDFGIDIIMTKYINHYYKLSHSILYNGLILKIIISIVSFFLCIILSYTFEYSDSILFILIIGISNIIIAITNTLSSFFQSKLQMFKLIIVGIAYIILIPSITSLIICLNADIIFLFANILISELVVIIIALLIYKINKITIIDKINLKILKVLFLKALPLGISAILIIIYQRLGLILLEKLRGVLELGYYGAINLLTEPFLLIAQAICISILPILTKYYKTNNLISLKLVFNRVRLILLSITFVLCITYLLYSNDIILAFYDVSYLIINNGILLLSIANIFIFYNILLTNTIISFNKHKYITYVTVINLSINLILNLSLIPLYGFLGVCISLLLTEIINCIIQNIFLKYIFPTK